MTTWALGYATKSGLLAVSDDGRKIKVRSTAVGNMFAPDPGDFVTKLISGLQPEDIVLTPTGPNDTYIAGCHSACAVHWIHTGTIEKLGIKDKLPGSLIPIFRENPNSFYFYQPMDADIAMLRLMVGEWLGTERDEIRLANGYSQRIRREREFFAYFPAKVSYWKARWVKFARQRLLRRLGKLGAKLQQHYLDQLDANLHDVSERLYGNYFSEHGLRANKERAALIAERLEWGGISELKEYLEKEVMDFLSTLPVNKLFEGLMSLDSKHSRVRAEFVAFMRNPLLYPNVRAFLAYAGSSIHEGQVLDRRHGTTHSGNPNFRKAICFDFGERYWSNDKIGIFSDLYYGYKMHQYYRYYDLLALTRDVFKSFGKQKKEDARGDEEEAPKLKASNTASIVREFVRRLKGMQDLPMIAKNPAILGAIEKLQENPDPKLLWRIFARGMTDKKKREYGFNLQITPKRIERQTRRMTGLMLAKALYYRWLGMLGAPVPFHQDDIYLNQYRLIYGAGEFPEQFDIEVVTAAYKTLADKMRQARTDDLPKPIRAKLMPPSDRYAFIETCTLAERLEIISSFSKKQREEFLPLVPKERHAALMKIKASEFEDDDEDEEEGDDDMNADTASSG